MSNYRIDTNCIHAGYHPENGEPRVLPIVQSTTYKYETAKNMGQLFDLEVPGFFLYPFGESNAGRSRAENCSHGRWRWSNADILRSGSFLDFHF